MFVIHVVMHLERVEVVQSGKGPFLGLPHSRAWYQTLVIG